MYIILSLGLFGPSILQLFWRVQMTTLGAHTNTSVYTLTCHWSLYFGANLQYTLDVPVRWCVWAAMSSYTSTSCLNLQGPRRSKSSGAWEKTSASSMVFGKVTSKTVQKVCEEEEVRPLMQHWDFVWMWTSSRHCDKICLVKFVTPFFHNVPLQMT